MFGRVYRRVNLLLLAVCLALSPALAFATDPTIPEVGVDPGAQITAAATKLGGYVALAIGVWFAFRIIKAALRWAGRAVA